MKIDRLLTNIISADLESSKIFYRALFSFKVNYESDWFIHLVSEESHLEIGILFEDHEIVPDRVRGEKSGMYITFVVDDLRPVFEIARASEYEILQTPEDTFYGQKRMLIVSPEGTVCDVSAPVQV